MIADPRGHRTRPSNRLKHGLTSRARAEDSFDEALKMSAELVGDAPRTPEIMDAAKALADQIILLQAIRQERKKLLTTPLPPRKYDVFLSDPECQDIAFDIITGGYLTELSKERRARWFVACIQYEKVAAAYVPGSEGATRLIQRRRLEFRRLDEYERKALSRRRKLLRMLDYLTVEALRGRQEMPARAAPS